MDYKRRQADIGYHDCLGRGAVDCVRAKAEWIRIEVRLRINHVGLQCDVLRGAAAGYIQRGR